MPGRPVCAPRLQGVLDEGHHHRSAGGRGGLQWAEPVPGALRSAFSTKALGRAGPLLRGHRLWPLCQKEGAPGWEEKGQGNGDVYRQARFCSPLHGAELAAPPPLPAQGHRLLAPQPGLDPHCSLAGTPVRPTLPSPGQHGAARCLSRFVCSGPFISAERCRMGSFREWRLP